jgi:Sec-independent protein translocase protein TatA
MSSLAEVSPMNFLGIGSMELITILVVGFLVLGPRRLLDVSKKVGKTIGQVRRSVEDLPSVLEEEIDLEHPEAKAPKKRRES